MSSKKNASDVERLTPAQVHERFKDKLDESGTHVPEFLKSVVSPDGGFTVGGYATDAYCANRTREGFFCVPGQGVGQTEREALRELRRDGWTIRRKKDEDGNVTEAVICPKCVRRGVRSV
jgi:hypothetical protein